MSKIANTKFIKTLKTLNESDWKDFERWLVSPWCNTNKNLIRLVHKLQKYHPKYEDRKLTKERLFSQVLPNGKFSDRRMNNLLSEGYQALERFLIFHRLAEDENLQQKLLAQEFQDRHLETAFFKHTHQQIEQITEKPIKDWEDHLDLLQYHRQVYHHPNQSSRMQPGGQTIVQMGEALDLVYLLEKAVIINEKIFRNRILKNENHEVEQAIAHWQLAAAAYEHPSLTLYQMRFAYQEENMLEQYFELRETFLKCYQELNVKEQKVHLMSLLNDTSILTRTGKLPFVEFLPLYKIGLDSRILLNNNILSYTTFISVVSASNTKKDFDYTFSFIEKFSPKIELKIRSDAENWAWAHTYYQMERYEDCLSILITYNFKHQPFSVVSKILTTQVYFDLYLIDESYQSYLYNYFDSFEKWINREKTQAKFNKKSYLRFVQLSRSIIKAYDSVNFQEDKLKILFEQENNYQAPTWLKNKVNEIIRLKS